MSAIAVIKQNLAGEEVFRYVGQPILRLPQGILIQANFSRPNLPFHGLTFGQGDRMVEAFFARRWFNIFQIHDRTDDHLKGWYCNIAMPAVIDVDSISFVDLALDLLVFPDGRQLVLDEDEFDALQLDEQRQVQARAALAELQQVFTPVDGLRIENEWLKLV